MIRDRREAEGESRLESEQIIEGISRPLTERPLYGTLKFSIRIRLIVRAFGLFSRKQARSNRGDYPRAFRAS